MEIRLQNRVSMRIGGFTLVELMMVLAIAIILMTLAVPSFSTVLQKQRIGTTVNDFFAAINLARSEAIQRGTRVDLVPTDGVDWGKGWTIFIDKNNNQKPDAGEKIIFTHGPVPDGITIKSALTDSNVQYLAYNGTGRSRTNANSQTPQTGSFSFNLDKQVRRIKINFLGRARTCDPVLEPASC
jgi:type IV fimbrial biogenesis protein FimT